MFWGLGVQDGGEWGQATGNLGEGPCRENRAGGGVRGSASIGVSSRQRSYRWQRGLGLLGLGRGVANKRKGVEEIRDAWLGWWLFKGIYGHQGLWECPSGGLWSHGQSESK